MQDINHPFNPRMSPHPSTLCLSFASLYIIKLRFHDGYAGACAREMHVSLRGWRELAARPPLALQPLPTAGSPAAVDLLAAPAECALRARRPSSFHRRG